MTAPLTRAAMALKPPQLREGRRCAVQISYQLEASAQTYLSDHTFQAFFQQNEIGQELQEFVRLLCAAVMENREKIDELIERSATNWKLARIAKVDLAILRVCVAELIIRTEVPKDVIISEGVELGKQFGSSSSGGFINGVLDSLARSVEAIHNNP
jgi:transcription antitermination factor NusB